MRLGFVQALLNLGGKKSSDENCECLSTINRGARAGTVRDMSYLTDPQTILALLVGELALTADTTKPVGSQLVLDDVPPLVLCSN